MPPVAAAIGLAVNTAVLSVGAAVGVSATTAFAAAQVLGQLAVGVALTAAQRALGVGKVSAVRAGVRVPAVSGESASETIMLGKYATPGDLLYQGSYGEPLVSAPNAFLVQVFELSGWPSDLNRVFINGEWCSLGPEITSGVLRGRPVLEYRRKGRDYLWVRFRDGSQTVPDPYLLEKFEDEDDTPWTTGMIGKGLPLAIVTARIKEGVHRGVPKCLFEMKGFPLYDPRRDSTRGGSGAQRLANRATWATTNNPAVMIWNILRGIYDPITGEFVWGVGVSPDDLPNADWFAAMNECDASSYRAGIEIRIAEMSPADAIEELLNACQGQIAEQSGQFIMRAGPTTIPVYSFTDDDIIITDPDEFDPFPGMDEILTGVSGDYVEPADGWAVRGAPQRGAEGNVGELRFPTVWDGDQAQRLMASALETSRRWRRHTLVLPPEARRLGPLDRVSWTSVRNNYTSKGFDVMMIEDLPGGNAAVALLETDPADYDAPELIPTETGFVTRPTTVLGGVLGFSVEPATITGAGGQTRAAIRINWNKNVDFVTSIRWQVRLADLSQTPGQGTVENPEPGDVDNTLVKNGEAVVKNGEPVVAGVIEDLTDGTALIADGILGNTDYEVRARYEPSGGIWDWSDWLPVTTPDIKIGANDLEASLLASIADAEAQVQAAIDAVIADLEISAEVVNDLEDQIAAAQASADAQIATVTTTVNGKTTTFRQPEPPVATAIGDEWIDSNDGNKRYVAGAVGSADWIEATDARIPASATAITNETVLRQTADNALAASINTVSSGLTSTQSTVSALSATTADLAGNAAAAYILRVKAGTGGALFEVVAWDGTVGAGSTAKIAADTIDLAGNVRANMLVVTGPRDNLNLDPIWEDPDYWGLPVTGGSSATEWVIQDSVAPTTLEVKSRRYRLRSPTNPSGTRTFFGPRLSVEPGKEYQITWYGRKFATADTVTGTVRVYWYDQNLNFLSFDQAGNYATTALASVSRTVEVAPADAVIARLAFVATAGTGSMVFGLTEIKPQIDGATMLTERSVVAKNLIATEAVLTAEAQILDALIVSAHIQNAAITEAKIATAAVGRLTIQNEAVAVQTFGTSFFPFSGSGTANFPFSMAVSGSFFVTVCLFFSGSPGSSSSTEVTVSTSSGDSYFHNTEGSTLSVVPTTVLVAGSGSGSQSFSLNWNLSPGISMGYRYILTRKYR